ncbi:MAG: tyrosine-type recombinase/integrase, partial [Cyanobacteria bacterium HKST-UBA02]|nr:tyrosine-type recombinase/integrase [Cyanobacteria bacterium HKST-UBA02]
DKGIKTFLIYRWVEGRAIKRTIGRYPDFSIEQARLEAKEMNVLLAKGKDPKKERKAHTKEITLGELFNHYLEKYAQDRCETASDMVKNFERYFGDWYQRNVSSISRLEVQNRINQLGKDGHPHRANRAHDSLRAVFQWGIKKGICQIDNPARGIDRFKTQSRERFIKPEELFRFFKALNEVNNTEIRDYIKMSLLTGARQKNVLAMRWDEIDFDLGTWRIPRTKNGDSQTVPLTSYALDLLHERKETSRGSWVFPGKVPGDHLKEPKATWRKIVREAELEDLRIHDLRRTLGSYMAMGNQSLQIIGMALGHKSHTSTQIYARLANDPVRQAMEQAQAEMLSVAGLIGQDAEVTDVEIVEVAIVESSDESEHGRK